jgi:Ku70/Ku80-like protein
VGPRANWKGFLKLAELSCPVALYTAASTSERIAFHMLNRATVRRQFIDEQTGQPVEPDAQVKGYATLLHLNPPGSYATAPRAHDDEFRSGGAIDRIPERLALAKASGADTVNFDQENVSDRLNEMTTRVAGRITASTRWEWRRIVEAVSMRGWESPQTASMRFDNVSPAAGRAAPYPSPAFMGAFEAFWGSGRALR